MFTTGVFTGRRCPTRPPLRTRKLANRPPAADRGEAGTKASRPCTVCLRRSVAPGGGAAWPGPPACRAPGGGAGEGGTACGGLAAGPGGGRLHVRLGRSTGRGRGERFHVLSAARPPLIHEGELVTADLDLVAVQEGCRLGAEAYSVDEDVGGWGCFPDDHLAVGLPLQQGVLRQHRRAGEGDRAACIAAERHLAHRDGELLAAEFEQCHLGGRKLTPDGVTAQGNTLYAMLTASSRPTRPLRSQYQNSSDPVITVA